MTSIPASAAGGAAGDSGGGVDGFDDAATGAGITALLQAVDTLASGESWRCSEADLGRLVQTVEVAQRRLDMVAATAAVQA